MADNNVDLELLKKQKQVLVGLTFENLPAFKLEALDGIINLLDIVQDDLEDHGVVTLVKHGR